jgi:hypothetical protein
VEVVDMAGSKVQAVVEVVLVVYFTIQAKVYQQDHIR